MRRTWRDVILAAFVVQYGLVGAWAALAPESFYETFPGGGRSWISADGPFNEHLVRDVGTLFMAIAAICLSALVVRSRSLTQAAGLAVAVFSAPHAIYHVATADLLPLSDGVVNALSLTLGLLLAAALAVSPAPGYLRRRGEVETR